MTATIKQLEFIERLFDEKQVPEDVRTKIYATVNAVEVKPVPHVREIIDGLIALPTPKREAGKAAYPKTTNQLIRDLDVQCSMYAIPRSFLPTAVSGMVNLARYVGDNDHLFIVVDEFRETRYVRQLHGAPGHFSRTKFDTKDEEAWLVSFLSADQLRYAQMFGSLYSCCSVCSAELTDPTSRSLKLGPTCRKRFGL